MKRKKRLEKGAGSIEKQIEKHKKKLENAEKNGETILLVYYKKELQKLESEKRKKIGKM